MVAENISGYKSLDGKVIWGIKDLPDNKPSEYFVYSIDDREVANNNVLSPPYLVKSKIHGKSICYYSEKSFPDEYRYCPECGESLFCSKDEELTSVVWLPPYGSFDGLKLWSFKKKVKIDTQGAVFSLPSETGIYAFCNAQFGCENRVLIAIQKNTGRLFGYDKYKDVWFLIDGTIGKIIHFPYWSWSVAVINNENILCVPCDDSVYIVRIDWLSNNALITRLNKRPVGGAVGYNGYFFVPVLSNRGLDIEVYDSVSESWFQAKWNGIFELKDKIMVLSHHSEKKMNGYTRIPVIDKWNECVYWSCYGGYIKLTLEKDKSSAICEYVPWETDKHPASALLQNGPPYLSNGGREILWQLCQDYDTESHRDNTIYKLFRLGSRPDGIEEEDWKTLKCGQILSTGRACFSTTDNFWNQIGIKDANTNVQRDIRVPLLEFIHSKTVLLIKIISRQDSGEFEDFTDIFGRNESTGQFCFVIEGSGIPEQPLIVDDHPGNESHSGASIFSYEMSRIPEIIAFISNNALNIYLPEMKKVYTWKIYYE